MTQFRVMAACALSGVLAAAPVAAQGKSGTHGGGAGTTHGQPVTSGTTTHGKSGEVSHGGSDSTTRGKSEATHGRSGETARGKDGDRDHDRTSTTGETTTAPSTGTSAVAAKISHNPEQLARITAMLPAGMTLEQATAGFRNQGQFIAALNASKNQGVVFADLQKAMTVDGLSLGQAVHKLRTEPAPAPATTATTPATGTTPTTGTTATTAKS
jgi:hypothetical protein